MHYFEQKQISMNKSWIHSCVTYLVVVGHLYSTGREGEQPSGYVN